jgi:hypothetical protein
MISADGNLPADYGIAAGGSGSYHHHQFHVLQGFQRLFGHLIVVNQLFEFFVMPQSDHQDILSE